MPELPEDGRLRDVLLLILKGRSRKAIARQLHLSAATVHDYEHALYQRYHVSGRNELMSLWVRADQPPKPDPPGP